jgi:hypothetical protein
MKLGWYILFLIFTFEKAQANCQGISLGISYFSQELQLKNATLSQKSKADQRGYELGYEFHFDFMDLNLQLIYGAGSMTTEFSQFFYSTFNSQWGLTAAKVALPIYEEGSNSIFLAATAGQQNLSLKDQPENLTLSFAETFQRYSVEFRSSMSEHSYVDFEIGHVAPFNKSVWKADLGFLF